jgi:hypothetical protein
LTLHKWQRDTQLTCVIGLGTARTRRLARICHVNLLFLAQPTCVLLVTQVHNKTTERILDVNNDVN